MLGAGLRHIGLAEDVPGDALHALVGPGDAGDLVLSSLCFLSELLDCCVTGYLPGVQSLA